MSNIPIIHFLNVPEFDEQGVDKTLTPSPWTTYMDYTQMDNP